MADFPNAPNVADEYIVNGVVYTWDGQKWVAAGSASGPAVDYLPLAGGSMLGPLYLYQDPLAALEAVPRRYLEEQLGALIAGVELCGVFDAMTGDIRWHSTTGQVGDVLPPPTIDLEGKFIICAVEGDNPPAGAPVEHYMAGDWLICNGIDAYYHIHIAMEFQAVDIEVNPAVLGAANVQTALEALATKATHIADTPPANPIPGELWWDTTRLQLYVWYHDGTSGQWVIAINDGGGGGGSGGISEAPLDGKQYGRQNAQWTETTAGTGGIPDAPQDGSYYGRVSATWNKVLPLAGGTLTGLLTLSGPPTNSLHAASKTYVDNGDAKQVSKAGDTMTGALTLPGPPTANLHAATKAYVDGKVPAGGSYLPLTGGTLTGHLGGTTATFTGELRVNNTVGGSNGNRVSGAANGSLRWSMRLGDSPDVAGNNDNDFCIERYSNNGTYLGTPFGIYRGTGCAEFDGGLIVHGSYGFPDLDGIHVGNPTPTGGDITGLFYTGTAGVDYNGEVGLLNCLCWSGASVDAAGNFNYGAGTGRAYKNGGGTWTAASDARIKTVQSDYTLGLDAVLQLNPVIYTYNGNDTPSADVMSRKGKVIEGAAVSAAPYPASEHAQVAEAQTPFVGLIAQEVEPVMPGMVGTKPGYIDGVATDIKTLDTSELIFALVNAVKDLAAQNTDLSARLAALEGAAP